MGVGTSCPQILQASSSNTDDRCEKLTSRVVQFIFIICFLCIHFKHIFNKDMSFQEF